MKGHLTDLQRQKQINTRLKNENARLREEVKRIPALEAEIVTLKQDLEKAFLLIEELQRMVFGKGQKKKDKDKDASNSAETSQRKKANRNASSYRRETPKEEDITEEVHRDFSACPHCQQKLTRLKQLEFFTEDILPPAEWFKVLKRVTRKWIVTGYCANCKKRVNSVEIPKQKVSLGENIRQLIVFQSTVQQLSYSQIIDFAEGILHLKLSQGEIVNSLESQSVKLKSAYLTIQEHIRTAQAVHLDETGYPTISGDQGNFAWVAANTKTEDIIYSIGQSRGKGNIPKMLGENFSGIGITDDYGAYKNIFNPGKHALCWAHPHRKLRDLQNSETLEKNKQLHCQKVFTRFSSLYEKVRAVNAQFFRKELREKAVLKLSKVFDECISPHPDDPQKLKQIKTRLGQQKDCYFVCLLIPGIPPDNNKAERSLRHLVIKRKKSFGCKTQKGADTLSVLYSVVMSLWRKSKRDFFGAYGQALEPLVGGQ